MMDRDYRFVLVRTINPTLKSKVMFIGVNPSTADANEDDQTTTKLIEFTRRWGFGKYVLMNLFPYRATDYRELEKYYNYPVHWRKNHQDLRKNIRQSDLIVPMWGRRKKVPQHLRVEARVVKNLINKETKDKKMVKCFGLTKCGEPKHPLMLGYDTPLLTIKSL